jgi:hypothetical protein
MKIVKVKKCFLKKDDSIGKISFLPRTYIFIDEDNTIYFGSSFIDNITDDSVYCVEWKKDGLKLSVCKSFEKAMVEEKNNARYDELSKEINEWVRLYFKKESQGKLDMDDREYRCIKKELYQAPPVYNFDIKGRNQKKKADEEKERKEMENCYPLF